MIFIFISLLSSHIISFSVFILSKSVYWNAEFCICFRFRRRRWEAIPIILSTHTRLPQLQAYGLSYKRLMANQSHRLAQTHTRLGFILLYYYYLISLQNKFIREYDHPHLIPLQITDAYSQACSASAVHSVSLVPFTRPQVRHWHEPYLLSDWSGTRETKW